MAYIDTSVLVAYYCPEPLSEAVQRFLMAQERPSVSFLTEVELFSAVARKIRMKEMDPADGNRIVAKFSSHMDAGFFTVIPVETHHWRLARGWIGLFTTPLRTLDALHLAITSADGMELVTSDKPLFQAAEMLDVKARLLEA